MNKNIVAYAAMFLAGALIGSGVTYTVVNKKLEDKYKEQTEKEIESVRSGFAKMQKEIYEKNEAQKAQIWKQWEADTLANNLGYKGTKDIPEPEVPAELSEKSTSELTQEVQNILDKASNEAVSNITKKPELIDNDIYIISQEQYGELDGYDMQDMSYYRNGVLTDNVGDVVENPKDVLGETVLTLLDTYADAGFTEAFVRDDIHGIDYEIDFADEDF